MNAGGHMGRRAFLRIAQAGMAALPLMPEQVSAQAAGGYSRQVKLGLIGCGGRGAWISNLFRANGGFVFTAAADYFEERAGRVGRQLGVPAAACFSGLDGYKRLIASGVEAVVLQTPPFFFPEHAAAALEAGLHIYMAKPVAIDIPGTRVIESLAKQAAAAKIVFQAD